MDDPTSISDPDAGGGRTDRAGRPAAISWGELVKWDQEVRLLRAKCSELLYGCRGMLAAVGPPGPLTADQLRAVRAGTPELSEREVFAEYRRVAEEREAGPPPPPAGADPAGWSRRAAELGVAAAALAARRDELRPIHRTLTNTVDPYVPMTEAEIEEMQRVLAGPPGPSILDLIAEVERELRP